MGIEKAKTTPSRAKLFLLWDSVQRIVSDPDAEESQLAEDHESRIRRHYNQLLGNLSVPDVVTQMFQIGKLTAKEHEHLQQFHSTPIRASEELLNIIIRNTRDVYECFLELLKTTKQHHVYQMLTCGEGNVCPDEQSVSEHSRRMRQNYVWLTESLDLDSGLLTILFSKEVLSCREFEQIVSEKNRFVRTEILLSIISRKSHDDFNKFILALKDTLQEEIVKRLTDNQIGAANESNTKTTIVRTFSSRLAGSSGERIPPKIPPKPRKPPLPSPVNTKIISRCKSLLPPMFQTPTAKRMEKQQNSTPKETVFQSGCKIYQKKRSIETLERHFRQFHNELQTEVSTKLVQIRQRTSSDSIWEIFFMKILQELENMKRQCVIQTKVADEKCERLMQEILHREIDCKTFKDDIEREKTRTKKHQIELQQAVYQLQTRLTVTQNENRTLSEKLKNSEAKVESLKMLIQQREHEVIEKESIIGKLKGQATQLDLKETQTESRNSKLQLTEDDTVLKMTTAQLKETQEKLNAAEAKLKELETRLKLTDKGTDELISEDELQDIYKSDPILVQTIRTKDGKNKNESIRGMTILGEELFVVRHLSSEVEVYDSMKFSFSRLWNVKKLISPLDIGSCNKNKCLYILDYKEPYSQSKEILRVDPNGNLIKNWSTGGVFGYGLSITHESNVILTVSFENKLIEYSPDGLLIREINLSSDSGILYPWHAIKLSNGHFLVSHGFNRDDLHRVCVVDAGGKLTKSFGGECGLTVGQLFNPFYLAVDENGFVIVADRENSRVLLLDSSLEFKREILSEAKHELRDPHRILLDQTNGRLFVADNETGSKRMCRSGRILIFDCCTIETSFDCRL